MKPEPCKKRNKSRSESVRGKPTHTHKSDHRVHFRYPKKLADKIYAWDPVTKKKGTITAFADRLETTDSSHRWEDFSEEKQRRMRPRRERNREETVSKITVERALRGENIEADNADMIADELGTDLNGIGAMQMYRELPSRLPDPDEIGLVLDQITQIVWEWLTEGNAEFRTCSGKRMPVHPELIYRFSGDWTSWNEFLDVPSNYSGKLSTARPARAI